MAVRSIGSVTIALGAVAIPAKLYTAQAMKDVSFNRLDRATGARVKQQILSAADDRVLQAVDLILGYEYTPGKFVTFEPNEVKALELAADSGRIRLVAVVPASTIDLLHVISANILGPDKGAARSYHLLASLLAHRGQAAIGQRGGARRDELLLLRPDLSGEGLILHECLYGDEVRLSTLLDRDVVPAGHVLSSTELELGSQLLDSLARPSFRAAVAGLQDTGRARVQAAVDRKVAGHQIVEPPPCADAAPLDLVEQLRASLPPGGPKKARPAPARARPRAS